MPSENKVQEDKTPRISVKLDEFDYKVINKMTENRNISLSKSISNIVHHWIETKPDILKKNYGVDIKKITEEIALESISASVDEFIAKLPQVFNLVEDISLEDLSDYLGVNVKAVKNLIFTQGDKIKKAGLNLKYKGDRIYKEG
jgi:hypothetical protein